MAQSNQKPKTGIYKTCQNKLIKIIAWHNDCDEWLPEIVPDWGDGVFLAFDYEAPDETIYKNTHMGEQSGWHMAQDGSDMLFAHEGMSSIVQLEFVEA